LIHAYGDESGQFEDALENRGPFSLGIVACAESMDCVRCPKRAVRRATDLTEARWYDMTDTQKRRFIDCLNDLDGKVLVGYAVLTHADFDRVRRSHDVYKLHQDALFGNSPTDMCIMGLVYAEILKRMGVEDDPLNRFVFDRVYSSKQSGFVKSAFENEFHELSTEHANSRKKQGVQAADCVAGAAAESKGVGETGIEEINDDLFTLPQRRFSKLSGTVCNRNPLRKTSHPLARPHRTSVSERTLLVSPTSVR